MQPYFFSMVVAAIMPSMGWLLQDLAVDLLQLQYIEPLMEWCLRTF
jgi:hypothetical protein